MTQPPHDEQEITNLLSQLGEHTPDYPADLLEKRRAAYEQGIAALGVGLAAGTGLGAAAAAEVWTVENILKGLIAAVLLVELAGGVWIYQTRIRQQNQLVPTSTPTLTFTPSPSATVTPSFTPTATSTATSAVTSAVTPFVESTERARPTDRGLHLGHTPTPPGHRDP